MLKPNASWVIALLYLLMLMVLVPGTGWVVFYGTSNHLAWSDYADNLKDLRFWLFLILIFLSQAAFLSLPVRLFDGAPVPRRSLLFPVGLSGLMMGILGFGFCTALSEFFIGKNYLEGAFAWLPFIVMVVLWIFWGIVFDRQSKRVDPPRMLEKQCRTLFAGSLLELLIVVPTHLAVRQREYCCAGGGTYLGIISGLAVMLFSFGPGVFFLYAGHWKKLKEKQRRLKAERAQKRGAGS